MNLPVKPEFHRAIGAGHLSFDCPCSEDQVKANPPSVVCTDPKGFDRTAFYKRFDEEVVRFFREHLVQRSSRHTPTRNPATLVSALVLPYSPPPVRAARASRSGAF